MPSGNRKLAMANGRCLLNLVFPVVQQCCSGRIYKLRNEGCMNKLQLNLSGKEVIVFGAARGIGRATGLAFFDEGCRVTGVDVIKPDAEVDDGRIEYVVGDVTSTDAIAKICEANPSIEHVVFSVGIGSGVLGFPFWNLDPSSWSRVMEVNLIGAVNVATAFAPKFAEKKRGTFLFLVSVAGQIGSQTDPPYSAAKAGLINFTQCAARDLAPYGVRANALSPGMVKTELNRSVWQAGQTDDGESLADSYEQWAEAKLQRICPMERWQTAEECAAMAVFLASDHARNITGQTINIDGGQVMHS